MWEYGGNVPSRGNGQCKGPEECTCFKCSNQKGSQRYKGNEPERHWWQMLSDMWWRKWPLCYYCDLKAQGHSCPHYLSLCIHRAAKPSHELTQNPVLVPALDWVLARVLCHLGIEESWPLLWGLLTLYKSHIYRTPWSSGLWISLSSQPPHSWLCWEWIQPKETRSAIFPLQSVEMVPRNANS